jgi:diaminopimelate epimerase
MRRQTICHDQHRYNLRMKLNFTKMHGAGNDFIVIDAITQDLDPGRITPAQWRLLADRRFGIGADQILVVERSTTPGIDFRYRIYNADGGEVEQCGNGSRAFVKFVRDRGLTDKRTIRVETLSGVIAPQIQEDGRITVDMGAPLLGPAQVPFDAAGLTPRLLGMEPLWPLDIGGSTIEVGVLSMGNPHAVLTVVDVDDAPVALQGPLIESHPRFARRVNAGFMQVVASDRIRLRVFERGAGETLACGTGACAAVVSGIRRGVLDAVVAVETRGGMLSISWTGNGAPVYLTGPAETVFEGEIDLPD